MKQTQNKKSTIYEVVNINDSKVLVENGEVKTILSETIRQNGYMSIEDAKRLTIEKIKKIYLMNDNEL